MLDHIFVKGARENNLKNIGGAHRPVRLGQVLPGL